MFWPCSTIMQTSSSQHNATRLYRYSIKHNHLIKHNSVVDWQPKYAPTEKTNKKWSIINKNFFPELSKTHIPYNNWKHPETHNSITTHAHKWNSKSNWKFSKKIILNERINEKDWTFGGAEGGSEPVSAGSWTSFFIRSMKSLFHIKSSEVRGSSSPPQYFLSLVVVGGPPYSPGATPVDHFNGFFFGSIILVCLGCGGGSAESWDMGVDAAVTDR